MYRFVVLCFALCLASVSATNVKQCSKGRPLPNSVDIEGCSVAPCTVLKGADAVMKVNFVGIRDNIKKLTTIVHATALGVTVPYQLPDDVANVCANLLNGATCPIDKSEDVTYNFKFYVDNSYPQIGVKVEVDLVDDAKKSVACFVVDIKVKKSLSAKILDNTIESA